MTEVSEVTEWMSADLGEARQERNEARAEAKALRAAITQHLAALDELRRQEEEAKNLPHGVGVGLDLLEAAQRVDDTETELRRLAGTGEA